MATKNSENSEEKNAIFYCEICDYTCSKKQHLRQHYNTIRHTSNAVENSVNKIKCTCKCGKIYKDRTGLWRHKKTCTSNNEVTQNSEINLVFSEKDEDDEDDIKLLSNIILEVVKQNKELMKENNDFKDMMLEQNKMMIDLAKNVGNNINNSNVNSHNKTFNLQFFLNETCKDAMNIMDFVDSLKLQLCDLERIGEVGFVTGISDIIIKNLKALDVSKRPVHCADSKREVMYVKDNNKWEKEQDDNKKIRKAIKHIAKKNSINIHLFKEKYPDCDHSHSRRSDQYNKIYIEAYGGSGNEDVDNENKIIKNIAKVVTISK